MCNRSKVDYSNPMPEQAETHPEHITPSSTIVAFIIMLGFWGIFWYILGRKPN